MNENALYIISVFALRLDRSVRALKLRSEIIGRRGLALTSGARCGESWWPHWLGSVFRQVWAQADIQHVLLGVYTTLSGRAVHGAASGGHRGKYLCNRDFYFSDKARMIDLKLVSCLVTF